VLDEVVQQAPVLLGGDACAVRTLEDEELVVSAAWGKGAEDTVGARAPTTSWLSGDVFQSRSPLAVEDAAADERLRDADAIRAAGHRQSAARGDRAHDHRGTAQEARS